MPVFNNILAGAAGQTGGAVVGPIKSVRFNPGDDAHLDRTPSSAGNQRTFTIAFWAKLCDISSNTNYFYTAGSGSPGGLNSLEIGIDLYNRLFISEYGATLSDYFIETTSAYHRDPSAWYHFIIAVDTTQSTATNRVKFYVNGVEQDKESTSYPFTQNRDTAINGTSKQTIGSDGASDLSGYLADFFLIDGSQKDPTDFGAFDDNGVWQAAEYSGTFGTNGFHLFDFANESGIGDDSSGNDNDFTVNNLQAPFDGALLSSSTGALPIHNTTGDYGGTIGSGLRTDSNASYLELAVPFTTAGSNSLTDDESPSGRTSSAKTLTASGTITSDSNDYQFYGSSASFGSSAYYSTSDSAFNFGTADFTIEFFVKQPSSDDGTLISTSTSSAATTTLNSRYYGSNGTIDVYTSGSYEYISITGNPVGQWVHVALCRSGGDTMKVFVNGTLKATNTNWSMNLANSGNFYINTGRDGQSSRHWQDLRVYKGLAKYSSSFTAPLAPYSDPDDDLLRDSPTNGNSSDDTGAGGEVSGNYCTWSPLAGTNVTLSNGNLDCSLSTGTTSKARATIAVTSGKYYWEITFKSGQYGMIGISDASLAGSQISYAAGVLNYYVQTGTLYGDVGGSFSDTSYGSALSANDVLGVALDMDNGNVRFIKNGSDTFGNANTSTLVGKTIMPHLGEAGGATFVTEANFGQRPFAYSAPSGYKALCTANLTASDVPDGSDYFEAKLFTGTGAAQTITGLEFQPDFTWIKVRDNARSHFLFDAVRGATEYLLADTTGAEVDDNTTLTAFTSDGFSVGTSADVNRSTSSIISYSWNGGGSTASNTDGSITSSVRANQSAGFSIVSFTAGSTSSYTVGHGLNAKPHFLIFKDRNTSGQPWVIYHDSLGSSKYLLFSTATEASASWGGDPTSSVFYAGTTFFVDGADIIGYCFAPVAGYSKFGKYLGNGNADGPFVYTGFRPAFVIIKGIDGGDHWYVYDTKRLGYNPANDQLTANISDAEYAASSYTSLDFVSNGFKIRGTIAGRNTNNVNYLYAVFAENPFQANGGLAR